MLTKIRYLGCNIILVTRMTAQSYTGHPFTFPIAIHRSRIEIVHSMCDGIVHQSVYPFLVDSPSFLIKHIAQRKQP